MMDQFVVGSVDNQEVLPVEEENLPEAEYGGEEEAAGLEGEEAKEKEEEEGGGELDVIELEDQKTYKVGDKELTGEEIKKGILMQADYTRKTQSLAEERRRLEAERKQLAETATQLAQQYEEWDRLLEMLALQEPDSDQLDALAKENPEEYVRVKHELEKRRRALELARKAVREQIGKVSERVAQENVRTLYTLIPDATDPAKLQEVLSDAAKFALSLPVPFTTEELARINDPRIVYALYLASKHKAAVESVKSTKKQESYKPVRSPQAARREGTQKIRPRDTAGYPMLSFPTMD